MTMLPDTVATDDPILLMTVAEMKALLGVPPANTDYDVVIQFADEVASSLIIDYTGRALVKATYVDNFVGRSDGWYGWAADGYVAGWSSEQPGWLSLREYPLITLDDVTVDGQVLDVATFTLHKLTGLIRAPGLNAVQPVTVTYTAGYFPLPAALRAVMLELTRRQLTSMGVDMSGVVTVSVPGVPVRGVSIGTLRVDYNLSLTGSSAKGPGSPVLGSVMEEFAGVLDLYRHPRRLMAVP